MYLHACQTNCPTALQRAWIASISVFCAGLTVAIVIVCAGRTPLSGSLSDLNIERELLAGSDALLERMVIPPNRPDWVLSQCADAGASGSTYDQIRKVVCEVSQQSARN